MAEKLDWFENGKMVTHPADPTPSADDISYQGNLEAGEYAPPQTLEELNTLNDMLLAQNQITDSDGNTLEDTMQSLKDAEEQAKLAAAAEQETLDKIAEEQAESANENLQYLVRGAVLRCRCGTHQRRLNLPECHGVYTLNHPMVHQLDCISGGPFSNIEAFGICSAEENPSGEKIILKKEILDEHGLAAGASEENEKGKPCTPVSSITFFGEIMSNRFSKPKSELRTPCAFLESMSVNSILRKSLCIDSGIGCCKNQGFKQQSAY